MIDRRGKPISPDADLFNLGFLCAPAAPKGATHADFPLSEKWQSIAADLREILSPTAKNVAREVVDAANKILHTFKAATVDSGYSGLDGRRNTSWEIHDYYFTCLLINEFRNRFERKDGVWCKRDVYVARFEI